MNIRQVVIAMLFLYHMTLHGQEFALDYNPATGAIDLIKVGTLDASYLEIVSASGIFIGPTPSHFNGLFDVYNANKAFKLDANGFGSVFGFALVRPGVTLSTLSADLAIDGALVDGAPLGLVDLVHEPDFCRTSAAALCVDFWSPLPDGLELFGDSEIRATGGNRGGGYLSVTDAGADQRGSVVFPTVGHNSQLVFGGSTGTINSNHDLDNIEMNYDGNNFSIRADVRIGGGTDQPGNGLSISFVRPGDPVLDDGDGFASAPSGEMDLPEEGSQTGLAIAFDEHRNGNGDVVGVSVRRDGDLIAQIPLPTLNGGWDNATSIQTGSNENGVDGLGWAKLEIDVTGVSSDGCYSDANIRIAYKQTEIFSGFVLTPRRGDFDRNGILDIRDLDMISRRVQGNQQCDAPFDLDEDQTVSNADLRIWIEEIFGSYFGDANLDGEFNSGDLVAAFSADEYEDDIAMNSVWAEGDWNGDREFDSGDLVVAFTGGGYELGPRFIKTIPEPGTPFCLMISTMAVFVWIRRQPQA